MAHHLESGKSIEDKDVGEKVKLSCFISKIFRIYLNCNSQLSHSLKNRECLKIYIDTYISYTSMFKMACIAQSSSHVFVKQIVTSFATGSELHSLRFQGQVKGEEWNIQLQGRE